MGMLELNINKEYLSYALYAVAILLVLSFIFFRNQIKNFILGFFIDNEFNDTSIVLFQNNHIIIENKKKELNITMKEALILFAIFLTAIVSQTLFVVLFVVFMFLRTYTIAQSLEPIELYSSLSNSKDKFIQLLNNYTYTHFNYIIESVFITSVVMFITAIKTESILIASMGTISFLAMYFFEFALIANIISYKTNFKYIEFFRLLKIISYLKTNNFVVTLIMFILSISTHLVSSLNGFSVFFWTMTIISFISTYILKALIESAKEKTKFLQEVEYKNYNNLAEIASYPNFKEISRGYRFTTLVEMKLLEIKNNAKADDTVHIDNYAFSPDAINKSLLLENTLLRNKLENSTQNYIKTLDLTKQLIVLGGMGSGKTELINYIVQQNHESNFSKFKAITFNDEAGDFTSRFYREDKDIIVTLFDKRAKAWDIFEEMKYNAEVGTSFISNIFSANMEEETDFFTTSAIMKTNKWLQESFYNTSSSIEAWNMFFDKLKAYKEEIKENDNATQSSILATIEIALDSLFIMYYQIAIEKRETFTFYEYVRATDKQLFFLNNSQFEEKLKGYMTGVLSAYIIALSAKTQDEIKNKDHLILNVFDEFLSMQRRLDNATTKTLLTKIRKYGACNVLMSQYLPNDDKFLQDLDSSRYALITFNINDDFTLEKVLKKFSKVEVVQKSMSSKTEEGQIASAEQLSSAGPASIFGLIKKDKKKKDYSYSLNEMNFFVEKQLQSMPLYHHITFIPSAETISLTQTMKTDAMQMILHDMNDMLNDVAKEAEILQKNNGVCYLGYTPQATLDYNNISFIKYDMKDFYIYIEEQEKQKEMSEEEKVNHYLNIKFSESSLSINQYAREHKLNKETLKEIFELMENSEEKTQALIEKYSVKERLKILDEFFEASSNSEKYLIIKKYDLFGAILSIFNEIENEEDTIKEIEAEEYEIQGADEAEEEEEYEIQSADEAEEEESEYNDE